MRVDGPISDEEFERVSDELKQVHADFYARYREEDPSESEPPAAVSDPAPEPPAEEGPSAGALS